MDLPPGDLGWKLLGRQANRLQLEIWSDLQLGPGDWQYSMSISVAMTPEGAESFFTWRSQLLESFNARLIVTSVLEEIRATLDAERAFLCLDDQDLTELPPELATLHHNLEDLSACNNRLSTLPDALGLLQQLTALDVSGNRLTELPRSIGQLTRLRVLRVNDNKLRRLPAEIGQLTQLRQLFIQQNRLTDLPPEFARIEALIEPQVKKPGYLVTPRFGFRGGQNPWIHPPEEIVRRGRQAIKEYLGAHPRRGAAEGKEAAYTVYADDNYHRYEENWKRRKLGSFIDCSAATEACMELVDDFLFSRREESAKDLAQAYRQFGEDPWICSDDPSCVFDAWSYADQRCGEIAKQIKPFPRKLTYTVFVDDNFHPMDESERYKLGDFADCDLAIAACRKIVDEFLGTSDIDTLDELLSAYRHFGEDPWISSPDPQCIFSAWKYAEQRCREIVAQREG